MENFNRYRFRVIIIGDSSCGKSSLLGSYARGEGYLTWDPTIGVDFFYRTLELKNGHHVRLDLWDTAGQEKFRALTRSYYRMAMGVLLAYNVTCKWSLIRLDNWLEEVKSITENVAVYQVVGCKSDLEKQREVITREGEEFAARHGFKFIETSAKKLYNVTETFNMIAEDIFEKIRISEVQDCTVIPRETEPSRNSRKQCTMKCSYCQFV